MSKGVGFTQQGAKRVVESTKYVEGMRKNVVPKGVQAVPRGNPGILTGTADGAITARVGPAPGTGQVILDVYDPTANTLTPGETVTVMNPYYDSVEDGSVVEIEIGQGAVYWLQGVGCSTDGTGGT